MTDPKPPADGYDASILDVLAGLDPPTPRPRAFNTFADDATFIAALNDVYARGGITANEMVEQLKEFRRQRLAGASPTEP